MTEGTATSPDGTAGPCNGEARATEDDEAATEAEYAAAKPDTAAASRSGIHCGQRRDRGREKRKKLFTVTQSSNLHSGQFFFSLKRRKLLV